MLSYRHAFHAGNHGDVLKHAVLSLIVEHLQKKAKPFVYIDTHAGAGRYDLNSEWAQKNREFETGILPLWQRKDLPTGLRSYIKIVRSMNPSGELRWYPGSPWLVQQLMRKHDKARLFELHNNEVHNLQTLFAKERNIKVEHADGLQAIKAVFPPLERRSITLIDPSYEIKDDFARVTNALQDAYRRFAVGVYMLWYPVIHRAYITRLENNIRNSGIRNVLLAELTVRPESTTGMTGSGIIVINPPWTLHDSLQEFLPYLTEVLGSASQPVNSGSYDNYGILGNYRLQTLIPE
ncbi:23S rRNA (adenine(2030)-N(6))-methyltransferase RlmJ [Kaarinaea lacus]